MSEWRNPTGRARKSLKNQPFSQKKQRDLETLNKVDSYLDNMTISQLGTFRAPRLYRKFDTPAINADGTINDSASRDINFALCKVTDRNDKTMTGRRNNHSYGSVERYGMTVSYVVVPLEDLADNGRKTFFEKIDDLSGATRVFDPRLVALSTYPSEISDTADMIKSQQEGAFAKNYRTINTDRELIEIGSDYYSSVAEFAVNSYRQMLNRSSEEDNFEDTPEE